MSRKIDKKLHRTVHKLTTKITHSPGILLRKIQVYICRCRNSLHPHRIHHSDMDCWCTHPYLNDHIEVSLHIWFRNATTGCKTRHWWTYGRLVQELNVYTVVYIQNCTQPYHSLLPKDSRIDFGQLCHFT